MSQGSKKRISVIGSGNWGSTVAKIIGGNVIQNPEMFEQEVRMWVFEETVDGRKLTDIINEDHENVKYLPGHKFTDNVRAMPDIVDAAKDADVLVFVVPHQFIERSCRPLVGNLKTGAQAISLIKGFAIVPSGGIRLMSVVIHELLGLPVSVLMGANIASEVAAGNFCETTIGCRDAKVDGPVFKAMFQTPNFRVSVVSDINTVEICGALKNVVACAAGFVDGLGLGDNTKAATIRIGLMEMMKYCVEHHKDYDSPDSHEMPKQATFFESCGVADLVTTCYGGRNRKVSEAFVTSGKPMAQLEAEMLGGQKLQGPETAAEVNFVLKKSGIEDQFPLLTSVHKICIGEMKPQDLIQQLRDHPVHEQATEGYTFIK